MENREKLSLRTGQFSANAKLGQQRSTLGMRISEESRHVYWRQLSMMGPLAEEHGIENAGDHIGRVKTKLVSAQGVLPRLLTEIAQNPFPLKFKLCLFMLSVVKRQSTRWTAMPALLYCHRSVAPPGRSCRHMSGESSAIVSRPTQRDPLLSAHTLSRITCIPILLALSLQYKHITRPLLASSPPSPIFIPSAWNIPSTSLPAIHPNFTIALTRHPQLSSRT